MSKLREDLAGELGEVLISDSALTEECVKICEMFNISASDLRFKWEAFSFSSSHTLKIFSLEAVLALKTQIQRERDIEIKRKQKQQRARPNIAMVNRGRGLAGFPRGLGAAQAKPVVGVRPLDDRKNIVAGPSKVLFKGPERDESSRKKRSYRYMYEKISERSEALDDRIEEFAELVREHYKIAELGDPSASTEEEIVVVGRIAIDYESSSSGDAKLNEASLTLESSRMMGSGARVPLRFDPHVKIRGFPKGSEGTGFFPGAIVALRGKNGGGGWFSVAEILSLPPLKVPPAPMVKPEPEETAFSLCLACGPFTLDADLKYKPWHNLLAVVKSTKPAVLVLTGPFVDSAHPKIQSGDIDHPPLEIFQSQFLYSLRDYLDISPGSIAIIVPSVRDIVSGHAVFPQGELAELSGDPRIRFLPNPCRFSINDVTFGISSVDVLFHLRKEEFFKSAQEVEPTPSASGRDPMGQLSRHVLQQRSFYPIFPVPADVSHEVNLDVTHAAQRLKLGVDLEEDYAPDVLVLPSRLKQFSKVIDNTVAMNPSFLSKGTFAVLEYDGHGSSAIWERLRVNVMRLDS